MPAYNPGGGQNPNDEMFSDGPTPPKDGMEEGDKGEVTGILPKDILGGKDFPVGSEVVLKIVAIHDQDIEVSYAPEEGKGEKEGYDEPHKEEPMSEGAPTNDNQSMMY